MHIDGSIAVVTGANRGLGRAFVEALLARGAAKIYAGARNPVTLNELVSAHGDRIVPLQLDVTRDAEVSAAAACATDATLLLNNAGRLVGSGLIATNDIIGLEREMAVNVFGLARMCLAFAPVLAENSGGAIINMLSVSSLVAFPPFGSYAASKAAAMSLTHSMRYELKGQGTRVAGIYAGLIDTDMIANVAGDKTSPADIVSNALDRFAAGDDDIGADDRARNVRAALHRYFTAVEEETWQKADDFLAAHPVGSG